MDNLEKRVLALFAEEFGKKLDLLDDLNEQGINSIQFTQFFVKLEQELQIEVPDDKMDIYELTTLKAVIELIRQYMPKP